MSSKRARLAVAAGALAALGGASGAVAVLADAHGAHRASAPVSPACARRVITDWSDGRIDGRYPIGCYRSALKSLPSDLQIYSSAPDDIAQALSRRIVQGHTPASAGTTAKGSRTLAGHSSAK